MILTLYISGVGEIESGYISVVKNSFGVDEESSVLGSMKLPAKYMIKLKADAAKTLSDRAPSCPFCLPVTIRFNKWEAQLEVPVMLRSLFVESGRLNKDQFKQYWQGMATSSEVTIYSNNMLSKSYEGLKAYLEKSNI